MGNSAPRNGLATMIVGALMLLASVLYVFLVEDPFPMWLIIGGAGVMFIGVGSAIQRRYSERTHQ
jgi:hypothetical protein